MEYEATVDIMRRIEERSEQLRRMIEELKRKLEE